MHICLLQTTACYAPMSIRLMQLAGCSLCAVMQGACLDVVQEAQKDSKEGVEKLRQLAHHARRLLPRFTQRDQALCSQLPRGALQRIRSCYLLTAHWHVRQLGIAVSNEQ